MSFFSPNSSLLREAFLAIAVVFAAFLPNALSAATIHVPSEQPTIQAGINAAINDDTVLVASGSANSPAIYTGSGNRDLDFGGKAIALRSVGGAKATVIDCGGSATEPHIGFNFHSSEAFNAVLDGFTIEGAYSSSLGAITCNSAAPAIRNCEIVNNAANGVLVFGSANPQITNSTVSHNSGSGIELGNPVTFDCGGLISECAIAHNGLQGILVHDCDTLQIVSCTVVGNGRTGIQLLGDMPKTDRLLSTATFVDKCISAFNGTRGIDKQPGFHGLSLTCNDAFGNSLSDFAGVDTFLTSTYGNFNADPQFCSRRLEDYGLKWPSACAPDFNLCGVLVGANEVGCTLICGDANSSRTISISDVVFLIQYIFVHGPAPSPLLIGDVNCDGVVSVSDVVRLLSFVFWGGQQPCAACD